MENLEFLHNLTEFKRKGTYFLNFEKFQALTDNTSIQIHDEETYVWKMYHLKTQEQAPNNLQAGFIYYGNL